jgi:hypothetical protein
MTSSLDPRAAKAATFAGAAIRPAHSHTARGVRSRLTPGPAPRIPRAEPGAGSRPGVMGSGTFQ